MKQMLRIGVIGVGNIGSAHATALKNGMVANAALSALCDNDPRRLEALKKEYPSVPLFKDSDELLKSDTVDAVVVSTPHYDHPVIALNAFRHGLHVLSEKPVGVFCQNVREAVNLAKASGKVYAVMFNQRTNPLYRRAYDIVQKGELGCLKRTLWTVTNWYRKDAYYASSAWRATWSGEGGGVLMNQAPHNLDLWQWICGMPTSVRAECRTRFHDIEVEDEATILARYANGAEGIFITSTGDYPGSNRLEISGTKGALIIENGTLTHYKAAIDEREFCKTVDAVENKIDTVVYKDDGTGGHICVLQNFVRAVLFGETPVATAEEALNELTLANAAYLSAWKNQTVSLPFSDDVYLTLLKEKIENSQKKSPLSEEKNKDGDYMDRWRVKW